MRGGGGVGVCAKGVCIKNRTECRFMLLYLPLMSLLLLRHSATHRMACRHKRADNDVGFWILNNIIIIAHTR